MFFPSRISDDEYVAKLRRSISLWDRWRFWLILLYAGLFVATCWLFCKIIATFLGMAQPANAPFALVGFLCGAMLGMSFGWMIYGTLHGLCSALSGLRAERLLLKHLDGCDSEEFESDQAPQPESDVGELHQHVDSW